jgi:hypothetical protein
MAGFYTALPLIITDRRFRLLRRRPCPELRADSAFRNLTSLVRASLQGIAPLPGVGGQPLNPCFEHLSAARVQETWKGEVRRGVARSPS